MIDLKLKSNIVDLKEDLDALLFQIETKAKIRSNEIDSLIKVLFEKHFFNSDSFLENNFHSFKIQLLSVFGIMVWKKQMKRNNGNWKMKEITGLTF